VGKWENIGEREEREKERKSVRDSVGVCVYVCVVGSYYAENRSSRMIKMIRKKCTKIKVRDNV